MDDLLKNIRTSLRTNFAGTIRAEYIYITPHLAFIPSSIRVPCIGIKDGTVKVIEEMSGFWEVELQVHLALLQEIRRDEAGIIGDATGKPGVIQLAETARGALAHNLLGMESSGLIAALWTSEGESMLFDNGGTMTVRKIQTWTYHRQISAAE